MRNIIKLEKNRHEKDGDKMKINLQYDSDNAPHKQCKVGNKFKTKTKIG